MKKIVTVVLSVVLLLSLGGIVAFAEKPVETRCFYGTNGGWFCDYQNMGCTLGNGCLSSFCGNYGTGVDMSGYVTERPAVTQTPSYSGSDQSNQGTAAVTWNGGGQGSGYVDNNGDGYCDNWTSGGQGSGYVDNNGDGYCDNWSGSYGGGHHGGGHHGGRHH